MNRGFIAALIIVLAGCVPASEQAPVTPLAQWGEDSGSLPPEFAWDYLVSFSSNGQVSARYCKGDATEAPGCATVTQNLPQAELDALTAALAPVTQALNAQPPQQSDDIPIGGGSIYGSVFGRGQAIHLPNYPQADGAVGVVQALDLLQNFTPEGLVDKAKAKAKQP